MFFIRDPWRHVTDLDSGFGNRLMCWEAALILSKLIHGNKNYFCLLPEFPELLHLEIPYMKYNTEDLPIPGNFSLITDEHINNFINTGRLNIDRNSNYELSYSWDSVVNIVRFAWTSNEEVIKEFKHYLNVEIRHLKLRNTNLQDSIVNFSNTKIGIHIRRGNGVYVQQKDIDTIPLQYQQYYKVCKHCDTSYIFQSDETIFNLMDYFLKVNKKVKFFISIDVGDKAIEYYKKRYPGSVYTVTDYINSHLIDRQDINSILNPIKGLNSIGLNLLDFFILSNCKFLISDKISSWSDFARKVGNHNKHHIGESPHYLNKLYEQQNNII